MFYPFNNGVDNFLSPVNLSVFFSARTLFICVAGMSLSTLSLLLPFFSVLYPYVSFVALLLRHHSLSISLYFSDSFVPVNGVSSIIFVPFASNMVASLPFSCPVDLHNYPKAPCASIQPSVMVVEGSLFLSHPVYASGGMLDILMPNVNIFFCAITLRFPIIEFQVMT